MLDDKNISPMTSDLPNPSAGAPDSSMSPPPENASADPAPFTLDPTQIAALGLGDCKIGESYDLKLRVTDADESGTSFEVESAAPSEGEDTGEEGTEAPDDGDGVKDTEGLGYSRKTKAPRAGLPDISKLRDL